MDLLIIGRRRESLYERSFQTLKQLAEAETEGDQLTQASVSSRADDSDIFWYDLLRQALSSNVTDETKARKVALSGVGRTERRPKCQTASIR